MMMNTKGLRSPKATSMAEMPLGILIIFVFAGFPFLCLCSIGLRVAFVQLICYEAARAASCSSTASAAVTAANNSVSSFITRFPGISTVYGAPIKTEIAVTALASPGSPKFVAAPLSAPAQTNTYVYQYRVSLDATIAPVVGYSGGFFGSVPGWSAPLIVKATSLAFCENSKGLNQ